jgi:hypothetical protein
MNSKRDNLYKLKDLLDQYSSVFEVGSEAVFEYWILYIKNLISLNEKEMNSNLTSEVKEYMQNLKKELKICSYILKHYNKINTSDMYYVFELLDKEYEDKYQYINDVFENFSTALSFESKNRFYLPRKRFDGLNEEKVALYKEYLKGFNTESLKDFMTEEEKIYTNQLFDETIKKSKIYDVNAQEFIDIFAVLIKESNNGILTTMPILPKVKDEMSFLINIHELTHNALLVREDIDRNNDLIFQEDLSIFYELLYKSRNSFVKSNLHTSELSQRLLYEYKNEPFLEQVEKVKFYSNNSANR